MKRHPRRWSLPPSFGSPFRAQGDETSPLPAPSGAALRAALRAGYLAPLGCQRPPALLLRSAERTLRVPLAREPMSLRSILRAALRASYLSHNCGTISAVLRFAPLDSGFRPRYVPQTRSCERGYVAVSCRGSRPSGTFSRTSLLATPRG